MEPRITGRSRGRARSAAAVVPAPGRAASAQAGGDGVRRPAVPPAPTAAPPRVTPTPVAFRADTGAAGDMAAVTQGVGAMAVVGGRGTRRGRRDEHMFYVTRPKHITEKTGEGGQLVQLFCNYFKLETQPDWVVQQYWCDFLPLVPSKRLRKGLLGEHREKLNNCYVFDGESILMTTARLGDQVEWFSTRRQDGAQITIKIKHTAELAPTHSQILQMFNTQMRRNLEHLKFVQINRRYFDQNAVAHIQNHNLELWSGIATAINQHDGGVLMVVDTIHKILRRDSVLDALRRCVERGGNYRDEAIRTVVGSICMTPYNNRTYKIDDIDWDRKPSDTFETRDGPKSYIDYYRTHYEKNIRDPNQPMLVVRPTEKDIRGGRDQPIYLVPELCVMTGLTDEMRSNFGLMKDLAQYTKLGPERRMHDLKRFMDRLRGNETVQKEMRAWNLSFGDQPMSIPGRILPPEQIFQGQGKSYSNDPITADFTRNLRGNKLLVPKNLNKWTLLCTKFAQQQSHKFVSELTGVGEPMGVNFSSPQVVTLVNDNTSSYTSALKQIAGDTELVMCVVPNNRKDRYDAIKRLACVDLGIPTQVMVQKTISNDKSLRSVATKVAIQMNCKLGGEAWKLRIPLSSAMICGYDTYHDSSQRNRSAGGFCAAMNSDCTRWYSRVSFHHTHQELTSCTHMHVTCALQQFRSINGSFPRMIIFYRDGVSDGQLKQVCELEVDQIRKAIDEVCAGQPEKPQLIFLVVTKRIAARFFQARGNQYDNPKPGTIVDTVVTIPIRYDFYVVSQSVRQGTVAPTHYNVVYDNTNLLPKHVQALSYKLCHLYFNWPGTIRVPAPCQYAHKLAFVAGQSLHEEPSQRLAHKLFYL